MAGDMHIITNSDYLSIALAASLCAALAVWPFRRTRRGEPEETPGYAELPEPAERETLDYLDWGVRLGMLGKTEGAAERFRQAIECDPEDAAAHYNLGIALDQLGQHIEAIASFRRAAELKPASVDVMANLGAACMAAGDLMGAFAQFESAVQAAPDDAPLRFNLGCAYLAAGRTEEAVISFQEAVKADPKDAQTRFNLSLALRKAGKPDLADNELRDFLALARGRYPEQRAYAEHILAQSDSS